MLRCECVVEDRNIFIFFSMMVCSEGRFCPKCGAAERRTQQGRL